MNISLKKYKNYKDIDNWAVPNLSISTLLPSGNISGADWYKDNKTYKALLERVAQNYDQSYSSHIFSKKFDFFTYEVDWQDILGVIFGEITIYGKQSVLPSKNPEEILAIANSNEWHYDPTINGEIKFLKQIANNKVKYACF